MEQSQLDISAVFKALSKPATIMGVDYDYFFIASLVVMLIFIYSSSLLSFLMFAPLHLVGWVLVKIDPHIFKLLSVRATVGVVNNKALWKCQTYEAY